MEVSEQIIEVLDKIGEKFGIAVDWTSSNIMPYLQQLCEKCVKYELLTSIVWIIFAMIITVPIISGLKYIFKNKELGVDTSWRSNDDYTKRVILYVLCVVGILICASVIMAQIFDIIACITYPEKIVINEIREYIN